VKKKKRKFY